MARVWLLRVRGRAGSVRRSRPDSGNAHYLPGDGDARVRVVRAQRPGSHRRGEVPAESGVPLGHLAQRGLDALLDVHPGALDVRAGLALPAAQPHRLGELAKDEVGLALDSLGPRQIVE